LALVSGGALLELWRPLPFLIAAAVLGAVTAVILVRVREPRSPVGCCLPQGLRAMLTASWDIWRGSGEVRAFVLANALWEFALAALKTFVVLFIVVGLGRSVGFASVLIGLGAAGSLVAATVSGSLGDRFGIARVMQIALWVYGLGLLIPFFTQANAVVATIPVIAFGGAVIMTLPYGLLMELMPEERHGATTGLYGFSRGLGIVLGPLVAGAAIDLFAPLLDSTQGYAALWLVMGAATLASIVPLRRIGRKG
jgi:MFS family permease